MKLSIFGIFFGLCKFTDFTLFERILTKPYFIHEYNSLDSFHLKPLLIWYMYSSLFYTTLVIFVNASSVLSFFLLNQNIKIDYMF